MSVTSRRLALQPASALQPVERSAAPCFEPDTAGAAARGTGERAPDHREVNGPGGPHDGVPRVIPPSSRPP